MPTFTNPKLVHVEPRGRGGALAGLAGAAVVVAGMVVVVTSDAFAVGVDAAVGVLSAACVAGALLAARNVLRDRGLLWRPARTVAAARVRVAVEPVRVPLAIEAPKHALTGIVISEAAVAVLAEAGD